MHLIALNPTNTDTTGQKSPKNAVQGALQLDNTADVAAQSAHWQLADTVELNFPKFTDGRAFSQAVLLRRLGYRGDIRATGDVLVDQLQQMQRCGFSSAQLRADQNPAHFASLQSLFSGFYQGDLLQPRPLFARQEQGA
jgi:uncharacterized protein (DUF934 family)